MTVDRKRLEDALRACKAPSEALIAETMDALEPFFVLTENAVDWPLPCALADPDSYEEVIESSLQTVVHRVRFVSLRSDPFPELTWREDARGFGSVERWYTRYLPKMRGETRRRIRALDRAFSKALYAPFHVGVMCKTGVWPGAPKRVLVTMGANTFGILDRFVTLVGLGHEAGARQMLPIVRYLPSIVPLGEDMTVLPFMPGHWIALSG